MFIMTEQTIIHQMFLVKMFHVEQFGGYKMNLKIKNYQNYIEQFRKKHIPERYNQVKLLDHLNDPEIDHFISISSRTDGKSINYVHALLNIAIDYNLGLMFLSRNMMLRQSYQTLLEDIFDLSTVLNREDFSFIRTQYYVSLNYKKRTIAIIADLNSATELKYFSNFIKKFPIMIYDEFLAIESDYLSDEWIRLQTIYESIDRVEEYPLIYKPKIFYLGNAVNFESPILHGLEIFNILEQHPLNTMKVYKYDFNIALEINRNENTNELRNTRAFGSKNDSMTTAQFQTNDFLIATENDKNHIKINPRTIFIKLKDDYLKIWFNPDDLTTILSIETTMTKDHYDYNQQLKDNTVSSIYLNESYYNENHIKKFDRGFYLFENNFSKNTITSENNNLNWIRINKIIREYMRKDNQQNEIESKEQQFKDNYIEQTKRGLLKKLWE